MFEKESRRMIIIMMMLITVMIAVALSIFVAYLMATIDNNRKIKRDKGVKAQ